MNCIKHLNRFPKKFSILFLKCQFNSHQILHIKVFTDEHELTIFSIGMLVCLFVDMPRAKSAKMILIKLSINFKHEYRKNF